MVVLRDYDLPGLSLVVVILKDLMVCSLKALIVPCDALEVVDRELRDLAVFLILLEQRLEGIVAEEGNLHEVFEALDGHGH